MQVQTLQGQNIEIESHEFSENIISNENNYSKINAENFELLETGYYEYNNTLIPKQVFKVGERVVIKGEPTFNTQGFLTTAS
ncbi:MAG: hypothetical protein WA584_23510 [Pyrinomonadaceae bacterium]